MNRLFTILVFCLGVGAFGCTGEQSSSVPSLEHNRAKVDVPPSGDPKQDLVLAEESKHFLLRYARYLCDGKFRAAEGLPVPEEVQEITAPVIIYSYVEDGTRRDSKRVDDPKLTLRGKLARHVPEVCAAGPDGYLHLAVVSYTARLPNFGIVGLFNNKVYEPQVTGIAYELGGKRVEIDPLEALEKNLGSKGTRTELAKRLAINPKKMPESNDLLIEIYRVIHFGETYPSRQFINFHRGHKVFTAADLTPQVLQERLQLIAQWYKNNVQDGQVHYEYSVSKQVYRDHKRTMVRSTMSTWILNRLAHFLDDDELKRLGAETIDYYLDRYFNISESLRKGEIIPSEEPLKNGNLVRNRYTAASFIAAAILERDDYKKRLQPAEMLMDWAMGFKRDDGVMWTQYAQSQYFMPGQLLLAVSYFYEKTKDEKHRKFFEEIWGAYETPLYDSMHLGNELYVPYAPAWFTQPLAKMYELTKDNRYRDMVYMINDRVARLYELNAQNQVYYDYDGVLSPKLGYWGNNSITSAHLESLVDAAVVAKLDGDEERLAAYKRVIRQTVAFLLRLQYIPENTYYIPHRDRVIGGFKKGLVNTTSWMDNVWHLTSAFMKIQNNNLLNP